jgi:hypothetical protein
MSEEKPMTAKEYAKSVEEWRDKMYHWMVFVQLLPCYEHERRMKAVSEFVERAFL